MSARFWVVAALVASALAGIASAQHAAVFPQVAVGGNYSTHLTVADPNGVSSQTKTVLAELFDDNGVPLVVSVDSGPPVTTFNIVLNRFEERAFVLTSSGGVRVGWMRLTTSGPGRFDAAVRYLQSSGGPNLGNPLDAVGVLPSELVHFWTVTVDKRNSADNVAVAVSNPTDRAIEITFRLFKGTTQIGTLVRRTLQPRGHLAAYVNEIMGSSFFDIGTLTIESSVYFNAMALGQSGPADFYGLPAFKATQVWDWTSGSLSGRWHWAFVDNGSFYGVERSAALNPPQTFMRGFFDNRFVLEYLSDGVGVKGVILFQGTLTTENNVDTVSGTRLVINESGAIVSSQSFKATRVDQ